MITLIKKRKKILKNSCLIALLSLFLIACEKDFVNIDSTLQGAQNFNTTKQEFPLISYSKAYGEAQTNNLPSNLLGYFNEPVYGKTLASIVTQVTPTEFNPDFGKEPVIESVRLNVPYFSEVNGETNDDGGTPYKLDSIFGERAVPVKLSIYQNNYLLRDLDPNTNFEDAQAYYSNAIQDLGLDTQLGQLVYEKEMYSHSSAEVLDITDPENIIRTPPALNAFLGPDPTVMGNTFWRDLLMDDQGNALPHLLNANNFREFFRGLVFKVEPISVADDSFHVMLDFANTNANITIKYTNLDSNDDRQDRTFVLRFNGIRLNTFENTYNFPLPDGDSTNGDDKLYVKGGVGSAGIISLFEGMVEDDNGDMVPSETFFRSKKEDWLINQANLTVYVDQSSMPNNSVGKNEPNRLVLYDLKNNVPVADYFLDVNTVNPEPDQSRILYAEPLERDSNKKGIKYKFRVTEHISNILKRDSTNVNLGIYVSTNVNLLFNSNGSALLNSLTFGSTEDEDDSTLDNVSI